MLQASSPHVWTFTFGCKVNVADTAEFERLLAKGQCDVNDHTRSPDTIVVNTCTVTQSADRQARQLIRKMHRDHPQAKIIVTGCYAQAKPKEVAELSGVCHVVTFDEQVQLPVLAGANPSATLQGHVYLGASRKTRAFLKVQNGCNAYCSFCILPYVRGRSRSRPIQELVQELIEIRDQGYQEVVLTGTHLGAFGRDLTPRITFAQLLREHFLAVPDVVFRVSSLEPTTLTPDLIRLVGQAPDRIMPHFHIPLQSGSPSVLRRMNRKYTIAGFIERVEKLCRGRQMGLGTDVIVGYPGETQAEFDETLRVCTELPWTYLHVFPYSPREGTASTRLIDDVPASVKKERVHVLRALSRRRKLAFAQSFVGQDIDVLIEKKRDGKGRLCGHSPHYLSVRLEGPDRLKARRARVHITHLEDDGDEGIYVVGDLR